MNLSPSYTVVLGEKNIFSIAVLVITECFQPASCKGQGLKVLFFFYSCHWWYGGSVGRAIV